MLGYVLTALAAIVVSVLIVWFCFMEHGGVAETYAIGFQADRTYDEEEEDLTLRPGDSYRV